MKPPLKNLLIIVAVSVFDVFAASQSVIVEGFTWKPDSTGRSFKINVCFEAQNTANEVALAKDALSKTWGYYSNIKFNFDLVYKKDNLSYYPCTPGFPGIKITLADVQPFSEVGVAYKAAPASEASMWPGGRMPSTVDMTLNRRLIAYPKPRDGASTNNLSSSEKEKIFAQEVIHEFGHALGFSHEHFTPAALTNLENECVAHINSHDTSGKVGERPTGNTILGTYSRLSIMHYDCPEDAQNPADGVYDVQVALGPSDIATARALYGIRNPNELPKAIWGDMNKVDNGLEDIEISGRETHNELKFNLGGAPGGGEFNSKYYTQSINIAEKIIPIVPSGLKGGPSWGFWLSGKLSQDGLPIFEGRSIDGTISIPIEVKLEPKNQIINSVSFPGYEIRLKHLGTAYTSFSLSNDGLNILKAFSNMEYQGWVGSKFDAEGNFYLTHHNSPLSKIWFYKYLRTQPDGYTFWIPKGFGSFDSVQNEFYEESNSRPKEGSWVLLPSGKFRVNSNYSVAKIELEVGNPGDESHRRVKLGNQLVLVLPFVASNKAPLISTIKPSVRKMKKISGGRYSNGKRIPPYFIGETEVTIVDYQLVTGKTPSNPPYLPYYPKGQVSLFDAIIYCNKRSELEGLSPVYSFDSETFSEGRCIGLSNLRVNCRKNGYRLPTEEEWKYAYFSKSTTTYFWGNDESIAWQYAWYHVQVLWHDWTFAFGNTVGIQKPNAFGLFDMAGNISEWTHSKETPNFGKPLGGNWMSEAEQLSGSYPHLTKSGDYSSELIGFRVVRKAPSIYPLMSLILSKKEN